MDTNFTTMVVDFENLMGGGDLGDTLNAIMTNLGTTIFNQVIANAEKSYTFPDYSPIFQMDRLVSVSDRRWSKAMKSSLNSNWFAGLNRLTVLFNSNVGSKLITTVSNWIGDDPVFDNKTFNSIEIG